jgi:WD40 repeat protein
MKPDGAPTPPDFLDLLLQEYLAAVQAGASPEEALARLARQHPGRADLLAELPGFLAQVDQAFPRNRAGTPTSLYRTSAGPAEAPDPGPLLTDYQLLEELGKGGMGIVFKACHRRVRRLVALKTIKASESATPEDVRRFLAEIEHTARLDHPNIVPIYEVGSWQPADGGPRAPCFTMKLLEGGTLAEQSARLGQDPRQAAQLLALVARAVHHAHQRGILHRDLKPSNVLLDAAGVPYVGDFGLARRLERDSSLTPSGAVVGTPEYVAPEQALGRKDLSTAADVYGLGAILYAVLTGQPPFRGGTLLETLEQVVGAEPRPPRGLNPKVERDLEIICLKCLHKEPSGRYGSAEALAEDLERWLRGEPIVARPVGTWERTARWVRRRPAAAAFVVLVLLAALGFSGGGWAVAERERRQAVREARLRETADRNEDAALRRLYALQLGDVARAWSGEPERVAALLEDPDRCPARLRDFTWGLFRGLGQRYRQPLAGHTGAVWAVASSPDGRGLATAGQDCTAVLWDLGGRQRRLTLRGHRADAMAAVFAPDGRTLATGSADGTVKLWDVATGAEKATLSGHEGRVLAVAFAPDGQRLACGCDGKLCLWDLARQPPVAATLEQDGAVWSVAFATGGKLLAAGHGNGVLTCRDADTGRLRLTLRGDAGLVRTVAFSADGRFLATGNSDGPARLWRADTGERVAGFQPARGVPCVAFSPDSRLLALGTAGEPGKAASGSAVRVYDLATLAPRSAWPGRTLQITGLAFAPDGRTLAAAAADSTVDLLDVSGTAEQATLTGHADRVEAVAFSPDGHALASAARDGSARLWDLATRRSVPLPHPCWVNAVAFAPEGQRLATGDNQGRLRLWDREGRESHSWSAHDRAITALAFSPARPILATASDDGTVRLWDLVARQERACLAHGGAVFALAFAPDGSLLATGSTVPGEGDDPPRGAVRLWDAATGQEKEEMGWTHAGLVFAVAFSPDGRSLVSAGADGVARLRDLASGAELVLHGMGEMYGVAFSPDGKVLASAAEGGDNRGAIHLWDPVTGDERATLRGHAGPIRCLAFSPSGRLLTTGGQDSAVKLWEAVFPD